MDEELKKLLAIQEVDARIDRLKAEMDEIPREKAIHQRELDKQREEFEEYSRQLEEIKTSTATLETKKTATIDHLAEFKNKLLEMKTNEAYRAMLEQIKFAEKRIGDIESQLLEKMYEEEQAEGDLEDAGKIWERNRRRFEKRQGILDGQLKELQEQMEELQAEREEVARGMTRRLLDKYRQLRTSGKGLVVVGLQNGNCGGCLTGIPPQTAVEISQGNTFVCPNCGRFVVWTDDSSLTG